MGLRDRLPCDIRSDLLVGGQPQKLECRLLERIGEGGMATVYLAEMNGRRVAVKYLNTELLLNQTSALDRFLREARLLNSLRHPNIIRVYNLGVDQEDCPFLVMELVENAKTLATFIEIWRYRRRQAGQPDQATGRYRTSLVPLKILLPLLRQVVEALAELHARGIVHRDIKPDNVLVTEVDGRLVAKLTDLGISKSLVSCDPQLTAENCVVGTPFYMAPEAVRACIINPADKKPWYVGTYSDNWGIGVVLYELMAGRKPYDAELEELPLTNRQRSSQEQANLLAANIVGKVADTNFRHAPISKFVDQPNQALAAMIDICLIKEPWLRPFDASTLIGLVEMAEREEERRERLSENVGLDFDQTEPLSIQIASGTRNSEIGDLPTIASSPPPQSSTEPLSEPKVERDRVVSADDGKSVDEVPKPALSRGAMIGFFVAAAVVCGLVIVALLKNSLASTMTVLAASDQPTSIVSPVDVWVAPTSAPAAAKRHPDSGPAHGTQAFRVFKMGQAAFQAGNCKMATKHMRAILAAYPAFPEPYKVLGECARRSGDLVEARDNFKRYLDFEGVAPLSSEAMKLVNP